MILSAFMVLVWVVNSWLAFRSGSPFLMLVGAGMLTAALVFWEAFEQALWDARHAAEQQASESKESEPVG